MSVNSRETKNLSVCKNKPAAGRHNRPPAPSPVQVTYTAQVREAQRTAGSVLKQSPFTGLRPSAPQGEVVVDSGNGRYLLSSREEGVPQDVRDVPPGHRDFRLDAEPPRDRRDLPPREPFGQAPRAQTCSDSAPGAGRLGES